MNRKIVVILTFLTFLIYSCESTEDPIPGINTEFSETFQIRIYSNNGESASRLIDIEDSDEYSSFRGKIASFELTRLSYQIKNYNAPEDMYITGDIICSNEENTDTCTAGSIQNENLSELAGSNAEKDIEISSGSKEKILEWLDSDGRFSVWSGYQFINSDGTPYLIDGTNAGSNFEMQIKLYMVVNTTL